MPYSGSAVSIVASTHRLLHLEHKSAEEFPDDGKKIRDRNEDRKNVEAELGPASDGLLLALVVLRVVVVVVVHLKHVNVACKSCSIRVPLNVRRKSTRQLGNSLGPLVLLSQENSGFSNKELTYNDISKAFFY